jgi:hypothetical protein
MEKQAKEKNKTVSRSIPLLNTQSQGKPDVPSNRVVILAAREAYSPCKA